MKKAISAFNKKKNSIMRRTDLKNRKQQEMSDGDWVKTNSEAVPWTRTHEHTYPGTVCE